MTPERLAEIEREQECNHSFAVDAECECGGTISGIMRDQHRAIRDLLTALREAQERVERLVAKCKYLTQQNTDYNARLRAYGRLVLVRPHKWLAVQDATEPVVIPEPESFVKIVEERDALQQRVEALGEVIRKIGKAIGEACREGEAALRGGETHEAHP